MALAPNYLSVNGNRRLVLAHFPWWRKGGCPSGALPIRRR